MLSDFSRAFNLHVALFAGMARLGPHRLLTTRRFGQPTAYVLLRPKNFGNQELDSLMETEKSNKPVFTDRRGRMDLAIFANETDHGTRYRSLITRSWKEELEGDKVEYHSTHQLDEQDLLNTAKLANVADDWIAAKRRER